MPSETFLMTQPEDWLQAFRDQAEAEGLGLSAWIGECCKANLPKSVQKQLSKRTGAGAPKRRKDEHGK